MTEPLTPPDCDLRDFAFMPLDVARILDSDVYALATGDEFRAAFSLWCKSWTQVPAASLPDDDRILAHLSGTGAKWKKVKAMALRGFVKCSDGRLYHSVVAEKANEAWKKKQSFRDRSRKGNEKRWGSQKDSQNDPKAIPKGLLERPKGQGTGDSGEGERNPLTPFGFVGRTIRLDAATLADWQQRYSGIHDLSAELSTLDEWLQQAAPAKRENWRTTICNTLNRKHQEAVASVAKARVNGNVTDDGWELPVC